MSTPVAATNVSGKVSHHKIKKLFQTNKNVKCERCSLGRNIILNEKIEDI